MKIKIYYLIIILSLNYSKVHAFQITDKMTISNSEFDIPSLENTGELQLKGTNFFKIHNVSGNGLIKVETGKTIIETNEFFFNGIILCEQKAEIEIIIHKLKKIIILRGKSTINFALDKKSKL